MMATLALAVVAGLAGCKVDTVHPISAAGVTPPDRSIYGAWQYREKGELTYVHIGPEFSLAAAGTAPPADQRTRIVIVDHKPNGLTGEAYVAHGSRLGQARYLNVLQVEDGKPAGYILVRYALAGRDTLRFSTVSEDALKAAIGAGRIAGSVRGAGLSSETAMTAGSAEIEAFLRAEGDRMFGKPVVLRRVTAP